jgi:pullulanase
MTPKLFIEKQTHFVLWRPGATKPPPRLLIGVVQPEAEDPYGDFQEIPLKVSHQFPELWQIAASECNLTDGQVYWYWFKVPDTNPYTEYHQVVYCGDPFAWTVDRRFAAPTPPQQEEQQPQPASVVLYRDRQLIACAPNGQILEQQRDRSATLPPNNRIVIYKLPTRWPQQQASGETTLIDGTFRDVLALLDREVDAPNLGKIAALTDEKPYLVKLGINALELLPIADGEDRENWGYETANYFAADFHLGCTDAMGSPTASLDLVQLASWCQQQGVRFFLDLAIAFARANPYHHLNFLDFFIHWGTNDPEQGDRDGFGGDLFKYNYWVEGYHPRTGEKAWFVPAREYIKLYILHWLETYGASGLRLDSINNIGNYDLIEEIKDMARSWWCDPDREGIAACNAREDDFLVVGSEANVPVRLIHQNRVDGLWNDKFKQILRQVILGKNAVGDRSFEWSVRKLIDCRFLGFTDGTQAVNYLTAHDVGGFGNERFYNYLVNNGITDGEAIEHRLKLAFVCLLTAVGVPLILAGDEFGDQQEFAIEEESDRRQIDPVNYNRLQDPWRKRLFEYVSRLVHLRVSSKALAVNDTNFLHADYNDGKRVLVWRRGIGDDVVVVVANFSDYGTPAPLSPEAEYVVANWPPTPSGKCWYEVTQDRLVLPEWVGREPIFPWEAKVYTLSDRS